MDESKLLIKFNRFCLVLLVVKVKDGKENGVVFELDFISCLKVEGCFYNYYELYVDLDENV